MIYSGIGLAVVAVVVLTWAFAPSGDDQSYPDGLRLVRPSNTESVPSQATIQIDLEPGYQISRLTVDGLEIPDNQINDVGGGTGSFLWGPGVGRAFSTWRPGEHQATVEFFNPNGVGGGTFTWVFRTQ